MRENMIDAAFRPWDQKPEIDNEQNQRVLLSQQESSSKQPSVALHLEARHEQKIK